MERNTQALVDVYREQQRSAAAVGGGAGAGGGARLQLAPPKGRGEREIRIGLIGHFPKRFLFILSHMSLIHMSINPSKFGVTLVRFGVGKVVLKVCVVA